MKFLKWTIKKMCIKTVANSYYAIGNYNPFRPKVDRYDLVALVGPEIKNHQKERLFQR